MKKICVILMSIMVITCFASCASNEEPKEAFTGKYIVDAQYVVDRMGSDDIVLVDCRGAEAAAKKTVKGAVATTWQEMCTCSEEYGEAGDENWGKIPEPADLAKRCGKLGLDKNKEIICLGHTAKGWGDDSRIAWELVAAGYTNVKFVDGGIDAVYDAGAETQKGASEPTSCKVTIDSIDKTHVMETAELQKNYSNYVIIDVRENKEYNGATLYGEARGGHMPNAIHINYTSLFDKNGKLLPAEEIEKMFSDAGVKKTDNIVTYCTAGIRSSYVQMVLEMMGYENTWNYDQSFYRWAVVGEIEK